MTSPRVVRAFVNAERVDVAEGATALDAVRAWSAAEADAVVRGERVITDSRGLPVAGDVPVQAGSIFRLISGRRGQGDAPAPAADDTDI
jgi:hypothetical protein